MGGRSGGAGKASLGHREAVAELLSRGLEAGLDTMTRDSQASTALHLAVRGGRAEVSAPKSSIRRFVITEKAPTRAFSWLKAATTAFTFKTLLRHYAKRALTPRSLNVKLGPRRNYHKGRQAHYANQRLFSIVS